MDAKQGMHALLVPVMKGGRQGREASVDSDASSATAGFVPASFEELASVCGSLPASRIRSASGSSCTKRAQPDSESHTTKKGGLNTTRVYQ